LQLSSVWNTGALQQSLHSTQEKFAGAPVINAKDGVGIRQEPITIMNVAVAQCHVVLLTVEQKKMNLEKSRVRCRVEHIFGAMKSRCRDEVLRTIGMSRAKLWVCVPMSDLGRWRRFLE
jgi:hypothetical protein